MDAFVSSTQTSVNGRVKIRLHKGNDQVRFDLAINALGPDLKIITPAREWKMSREQAIVYGEKFGIPAPVSYTHLTLPTKA